MKLPLDDSATNGRQFIDLGPDIATTILRTIEAGWLLALEMPEVNTDIGEVKLTERLRDGMRRALKSGSLPWGKTMIVLPGTESRSHPKYWCLMAELIFRLCWLRYSAVLASTIPTRSLNVSVSTVTILICVASTLWKALTASKPASTRGITPPGS